MNKTTQIFLALFAILAATIALGWWPGMVSEWLGPVLYALATGGMAVAVVWLLRAKNQKLAVIWLLAVTVYLLLPTGLVGWRWRNLSQAPVTVLSLNIQKFDHDKAHPVRPDTGLWHFYHNFKSLVNKQQPAIMCLQEFYTYAGLPQFNIRPDVEKQGYRYFVYYPVLVGNAGKGPQLVGNAIFSKWPVVASGQVPLTVPEGSNQAIYAHIVPPGHTDTLLVINAHLQSYRFSRFKPSDTLSLFGHMVRMHQYRSRQIDQLNAFIKKHKHQPTVLCGDFNTMPATKAYRNLSVHLPYGWFGGGQGLGFTYPGFFPLARIDHCQANRPVQIAIGQALPFTDHLPVFIKMQTKP